jgi:hypothetical protein
MPQKDALSVSKHFSAPLRRTHIYCFFSPTAWLSKSAKFIHIRGLTRSKETKNLDTIQDKHDVGRTKAGKFSGFALPSLIVPHANKIISVDTQQIMVKTMPCKLICNQKRRKSHMALRLNYN